jgi:hypothetical protein
MRLQGRLVPVADVSPAQRDAMFALMDRHYENMRRPAFDADLEEKKWVILLLDPATAEVCGFSTQVVLHAETEGRPIQALFSGDTIVDRDRWGDPALAHVWGRLALSLIDASQGAELYWFLISKGYKTYRFLPLFFREFYPRHDVPTPEWAQRVLDALSRRKFRADYDASAGLVRAFPGKDRLRPHVAEVTPDRLRDPHVAFFVRRNPGHARGDELCCVAPLTRANFTAAAYRVIGPEPARLGVASG